MNEASGPTGDRLRSHPEERFSAGQRKIDLEQATAELQAEDRASGHGHRQKTLYKHGGATIALFSFEADSRLSEHRTRGTVTIHALEGRLRITAGGESYDLTPGQLVVLAPDVPHDVTAVVSSRMLLHVSLEAPAVGGRG